MVGGYLGWVGITQHRGLQGLRARSGARPGSRRRVRADYAPPLRDPALCAATCARRTATVRPRATMKLRATRGNRHARHVITVGEGACIGARIMRAAALALRARDHARRLRARITRSRGRAPMESRQPSPPPLWGGRDVCRNRLIHL